MKIKASYAANLIAAFKGAYSAVYGKPAPEVTFDGERFYWRDEPHHLREMEARVRSLQSRVRQAEQRAKQ